MAAFVAGAVLIAGILAARPAGATTKSYCAIPTTRIALNAQPTSSRLFRRRLVIRIGFVTQLQRGLR
jgi:hypothetical protein